MLVFDLAFAGSKEQRNTPKRGKADKSIYNATYESCLGTE